jgi:hypothetical protein
MKTIAYFGIAAICIAIFIGATVSFDQYPNGSVTNVKFTDQAKTLRLTADYPRQYAADINKHILTLLAPGTNIDLVYNQKIRCILKMAQSLVLRFQTIT